MENTEQAALLGLLGSVYGETKKIDDMIVGQSNQLKRVSDTVKNTFTSVLQNKSQLQPQPQQFQSPQFQPTAVISSTPLPPPEFSGENQNILFDINKKLGIIVELLQPKKRKKRKNVKNSKITTKKVSGINIESSQSVHTQNTEWGNEHSSELT